MDHLPVVLGDDELAVARHPGLNYAPWNFDEREAVKRGERYFIRFKNPAVGCEQPWVFLHYSAFKYAELARGSYSHKGISMEGREPALVELILLYGKRIAELDGLSYFSLPYSYDRFSDSTPVQYSHRRTFKRLLEEGHAFADPFDSAGLLYRLLRRARMLSAPSFSPERVPVARVEGVERKVRIIDAAMTALIRVIGHTRFALLARFMIRYLHIHNRARLLGPEFRKLKVESF
jgi:hypothetical protein